MRLLRLITPLIVTLYDLWPRYGDLVTRYLICVIVTLPLLDGVGAVTVQFDLPPRLLCDYVVAAVTLTVTIYDLYYGQPVDVTIVPVPHPAVARWTRFYAHVVIDLRSRLFPLLVIDCDLFTDCSANTLLICCYNCQPDGGTITTHCYVVVVVVTLLGYCW